MAPREADPEGPLRGQCELARLRGTGGDAELRTDEREPERSETRGVGDTRVSGAAAEASQRDGVGGTQEIVRKERRRGEWIRIWIRQERGRKCEEGNEGLRT